jgi:hypothetical protein
LRYEWFAAIREGVMSFDRIRAAQEAVLGELQDADLSYLMRQVPELSLDDQEVFELSGRDGQPRGAASVFFEKDVVLCVKLHHLGTMGLERSAPAVQRPSAVKSEILGEPVDSAWRHSTRV